MDQRTDEALAKILWDYLLLDMPLTPADVILVLGSNDLRVADRAAELMLQGLAPIAMCTGGIAHQDDLLATSWSLPEAEVFAARMIKLGVPREKILLEPRATNSGENILFSRILLKSHGIEPKSLIVMQKPFMQRRAFATFKKMWPEPEILLAAPLMSFDEWMRGPIPVETVINIMVGDLERMREYPARGYQIAQEIPDEVLRAFEELVGRGYTKHLIRS